MKNMTKFCSNEPYYIFLAQKFIENDVLKVDTLKMKDFLVCRNFWCQILAKIGDNECLKMDFTLRFKFLCLVSLQNNQKPPKECPVKIWCHSNKIFRSFKKNREGSLRPPPKTRIRVVSKRDLKIENLG